MRTLAATLFVSVLTRPGTALAAWGDPWGGMIWGETLSAPTLPGLGLIALATTLSATAAWRLRHRRGALGLAMLLMLLAVPLVVAAGTVSVPNTFVNGEVADADQVNANFDAVETAVNDNDALITALETDTVAAQSTADAAATDAAAAQATADAATTDAAAAQATADAATTDAAAAQATADAATTDAAAALSTTDANTTEIASHDTDIANNAAAIASNSSALAALGAATGLEACPDGLTVADHDTGLLWEKKTGTPGAAVNCFVPTDCIDAHDINNKYFLYDNPSTLNGTAYTNFLAKLNDSSGSSLWFSSAAAETGTQVSGCFDGHCDWRLPNAAELQTIQAELQAHSPGGTHPIFGLASGTGTVYYSATIVAPYDPAFPLDGFVYKVNFHPTCATFPEIVRACILDSETGTDMEHVRAVRAGSCTH